MPFHRHDDVAIYYEQRGSGPPVLLLPGGALNATIDFWERAAFNPIEVLSQHFRTIAIDQRNAGRSTGPLDLEDAWGSFASDSLLLMDHLGIERFLVLGCCIGCSHALKIAELAPERVAACVLKQPVGIADGNAEAINGAWKPWAEQVRGTRQLDDDDIAAFGTALLAGEFVLSVDRAFVESCPVPLLVLPGIDEPHPTAIGREIAAMAPRGELLEPWKKPSSLVPATVAYVVQFLEKHAPSGG